MSLTHLRMSIDCEGGGKKENSKDEFRERAGGVQPGKGQLREEKEEGEEQEEEQNRIKRRRKRELKAT